MNSSRNKHISFLMPAAGNKPGGGYKVVYQYANRLAESGYVVDIVYSCFYPLNLPTLHKMLRRIKYGLVFIEHHFLKDFSCKKWFALVPSINERYVWSLYTSHIPSYDLYVATAAVTANALQRFQVPPQNKLYLIQGYEPWQIGEKALFDTYQLDCTKIVISRWIKRIVDNYSPCIYVPNGFDSNEFKLTNPIENRDPYTISILYHEMTTKGFSIGYDALCRVKKEFPQLKVLAFGVYKRPSYLPSWFEYYRSPDNETHNSINNKASVYLGTSSTEGYGLTIGEAMMCGQAVVCTDNDGYREMVIPDENALVCPIQNPDALAKAIIRLIKDDNLRISLAKAGNRHIQGYTIDNSFVKLQALLNQ